jgi:hypothetical protein
VNAKELIAALGAFPGDYDVEVLVEGEAFGIDGVEVDVREQPGAGIENGVEELTIPTYTVLQIVADG